MDLQLFELLKSNGLATVLVVIALPWIARRVDRLIDRFEKHLDVMDAMHKDIAEMKTVGCGRQAGAGAPAIGRTAPLAS
jgi:hypothetical protein